MSASPLAQPLMSMSASDPFHVFKDAVKSRVDEVDLLFARWSAQFESTNTAESSDFQTLHAELLGQLTQAEGDLRGIDHAVSAVERSRSKFPHIDDRELQARKDFITSTRSKLAEIKGVVTSKRTQGKMDQDRRSMLTTHRDGQRAGAKAASAYEMANDDFMSEHKSQQEMVLKEQDEHLDELSAGVSRLSEMATGINVEIDDQIREMDEMDEEVTQVQGKMDMAMKHIEKLLKTKDRCQMYTIFFLILVLIALGIAVATGG